MLTFKRGAVFFAGVLAGLCELSAATVRPADDGRALINPGMGFVMHYYDNRTANYGAQLEPGDDMSWFPGCSVCYLRLPWAVVEPEEGKYNWTALDTPAQRWIERGGQIAFRITCSEGWMEYATPKWVFDAGAKSVRWNFGWGKGGGPAADGYAVDPEFADPVFLQKLENFLKAFAARYDGRPEVAFVDVGTYGLWGEGHTHGSSRVPQERMNREVKLHIDLHCKYFKQSQLVISDDVAFPSNPEANPELLAYARERGVGWRDDSILVARTVRTRRWFHENQAALFWPTLPTVVETEHFDPSKYDTDWSDEVFVKAVEAHHASYISIHGVAKGIWDANRPAVERINRRIGYRFAPTEVTWPDEARVGERAEPFNVTWSWCNRGVAPSYRSWYPCLTVKDSQGRILAVMADEGLDLSKLPVAEPGAAPAVTHKAEFLLGRWTAPVIPEGTFEVFVSVGEADGTPRIELPLPESDGNRRYRLGKIRLRRSRGHK